MERMRIADVEEDIDHELVSKEQIDAKIHEMAALASEITAIRIRCSSRC